MSHSQILGPVTPRDRSRSTFWTTVLFLQYWMEDKVQKWSNSKSNITTSEPNRIYLCHVFYYLLVILECVESIKLGLKKIRGKCEQIMLKSVILLTFIDYNGLKNVLFWLNLLLFLISIVASITFSYNFKRGIQLKPIFGTVDGTVCACD
jgi:hypothetical protein